MDRRPSLMEVFTTFLKLGATGFGGPIALIALLDRECRVNKQWISREEFNEAVLFCKLLPGPLAYQVALWIGKSVRGLPGGILACFGFLLPGFTLILTIGVFYDALQGAELFGWVLGGVRTSALVVILFSVWTLAEPFRRRSSAWLFMVMGAAWMYFVPRWEPVSILAGGLLMVILRSRIRTGMRAVVDPVSVLLLWTVFWVHFKAGAFVYGTGVAVLPFLQHEAVTIQKWMTSQQFLDAIAFGQITPGPLTIASAFIGYEAAGLGGAVVGTLGMYLPGMILVLLIVPLIYSRWRGKQWLVDFQSGAMPIVVGGILGAWLVLLPAAVPSPSAAVQTGFLAVLLWRFPRTPAWLVMGMGGLLGVLVQVASQ